MAKSPYNSKILFPKQKDQFLGVFDSSQLQSLLISSAYTRFWAEHYNKVANFIETVEPLISPTTANNDNTFKSLTYTYTLPPVSINTLLRACALKAEREGNSPPSHLIPFEFILTTDETQDYSRWPGISMVKQTTLAELNEIVAGYNIFSIVPQVSVNIKHTDNIVEDLMDNWVVNAYCIVSSDTILIRGALINTDLPTVTGTSLPTKLLAFPDASEYLIQVTLMGVIPNA